MKPHINVLCVKPRIVKGANWSSFRGKWLCMTNPAPTGVGYDPASAYEAWGYALANDRSYAEVKDGRGPSLAPPLQQERSAGEGDMSIAESGFSLEPDESMRWIYDPSDPRYNSDEVRDLRDRRAYALRHAPRWMIEQAEINDFLRKNRDRALRATET